MGVLSESLPMTHTTSDDSFEHEGPVDIEHAWIDAARSDPRAFAPLYDRYATQIYRFCYRKVGDPDVANDLTAQIFTRAIERIDRYKDWDDATFRSWLFAIARNIITDRWRRFRPSTPFDPARHTLVDQQPGPEERATHTDELGRLMAVLDQLHGNQREIMELRLSGLTTVEVGAVMGISQSAVKSAQSRAYKHLRKLLAPPEGGSK